MLCFVWRARLGKIPSALELIKKGVHINSLNCQTWGNNTKCSNHLLVSCLMAEQVINTILNWCGLTIQRFESVMEIVTFACKQGKNRKKQKVLCSIIFCVLWCIWRARNELVYKGIKTSSTAIVDIVKSMVFVWLKHKSSKGSLDWKSLDFFSL